MAVPKHSNAPAVRADRENRADIDLGLALLSCLLRPGESLTTEDMAAWCGCSRSAIQRIEQHALAKVRRQIIAEMGEEIESLLATFDAAA